ncbi:MAG: NADH-quinone oxidoreductase subunit I [Candidatus Omnitrophica bacterium]|nr:NADH-quinone oxidoreductase subunit I [Candidatus Omnitrophota bacterium]
MSTKVMHHRPLNFWERIYVPEVARGLWVTSRHFARNLFIHTAHRLGLLKHLQAAVTIQYPEEVRPYAERLRTRHRLTQREDGSPRCVACMMCETVCPAKCIYIVAEEDPDPNIEKRPKSFDIDLGVCVYCGYCVEVCPEDAIRMDTKIMNIASYSREGMWYNMDRLLHPEKEGDVLLKPKT